MSFSEHKKKEAKDLEAIRKRQQAFQVDMGKASKKHGIKLGTQSAITPDGRITAQIVLIPDEEVQKAKESLITDPDA